MAYKRWRGNTGQGIRVPTPGDEGPGPPPPPMPPPPPVRPPPPPPGISFAGESLEGLLSRLDPGRLEREDWLALEDPDADSRYSLVFDLATVWDCLEEEDAETLAALIQETGLARSREEALHQLQYLHLCGIVFFQEVVDLLDAVAADGKAGVGVVDGQVILVTDIDNPLAEAALMLHGLFSHNNFLSVCEVA